MIFMYLTVSISPYWYREYILVSFLYLLLHCILFQTSDRTNIDAQAHESFERGEFNYSNFNLNICKFIYRLNWYPHI